MDGTMKDIENWIVKDVSACVGQDARGWPGKWPSLADQTARGILSHGSQMSTLRSTVGQRWATNSDGTFVICFQRLCWRCSFFPGVLSKGHVRCPWHGACFNIATGDIEDFPGLDSLPTFQVTPHYSLAAPTDPSSSTFPALIISLSAFERCTHDSCLFAPGQSWEGQSDHSCKQAGKTNKNLEDLRRS